MCKAVGIPANLKKAELIARLEEEAKAEGTKKEPPAPAKPQGQKAASGGDEGTKTAAATAAGGTRPPTGGGAAVRTDGIRGLCLGASQNPNGDASSGKARDGCESRQYSPLNKIRADVEVGGRRADAWIG